MENTAVEPDEGGEGGKVEEMPVEILPDLEVELVNDLQEAESPQTAREDAADVVSDAIPTEATPVHDSDTPTQDNVHPIAATLLSEPKKSQEVEKDSTTKEVEKDSTTEEVKILAGASNVVEQDVALTVTADDEIAQSDAGDSILSGDDDERQPDWSAAPLCVRDPFIAQKVRFLFPSLSSLPLFPTVPFPKLTIPRGCSIYRMSLARSGSPRLSASERIVKGCICC